MKIHTIEITNYKAFHGTHKINMGRWQAPCFWPSRYENVGVSRSANSLGVWLPSEVWGRVSL